MYVPMVQHTTLLLKAALQFVVHFNNIMMDLASASVHITELTEFVSNAQMALNTTPPLKIVFLSVPTTKYLSSTHANVSLALLGFMDFAKIALLELDSTP